MLSRLKRLTRPSPSMAVALLALFVALGGTSWAAIKITGRNVVNSSLTGADISNESIGTRDVKGLRLRDFAKGQAPKDGAKGDPGTPGKDGINGTPGPFTDTLPSGKTLRGTFATGGRDTGPGAVGYDSISFGLVLATAPVAHFLTFGTPPTAQCPGNAQAPEAAQGHLCLYEDIGSGSRFVFNPADGDTNDASRFGAGVIVSDPTGDASTAGSWAVTAP